MGLTVTTPALVSPVTLVDARRQCRIHTSDTTYDADLTELIADAVAHVENDAHIALEPTGYRYTLDAFDGDIVLPISPIISVESIEYDAGLEEFTAIAEADYSVVLPERKIVTNGSWPTPLPGVERVRVEFTAGFEGELDSATWISATPRPLRRAILLLVGHWFAHREAVMVGVTPEAVKLAYDDLLALYRQPVFA